jgi:peroxidase
MFIMGFASSRPKDATLGLDLTALNIQRGRDHGLPTYGKMLAFFGQPFPSRFDQLLSLIPQQVRINFQLFFAFLV